jgi:hypothetical protein
MTCPSSDADASEVTVQKLIDVTQSECPNRFETSSTKAVDPPRLSDEPDDIAIRAICDVSSGAIRHTRITFSCPPAAKNTQPSHAQNASDIHHADPSIDTDEPVRGA